MQRGVAMKVAAVIFPMYPEFRVVIFGLSHGENIFIGQLLDRHSLIAALLKVGLTKLEEREAMIQHDFDQHFITMQAEVEVEDVLAAGFILHSRSSIQ
jgi:hypothetical protein